MERLAFPLIVVSQVPLLQLKALLERDVMETNVKKLMKSSIALGDIAS